MLADYVGIPYGFRDDPGLDCYQLTKEVLEKEFDQQVPDYEYHGTEEDAWIAMAANRVEWFDGDGSPGDVVLLRIGRYQHCGVCLGNNQMIHTLKGHNSAIEDYTSIKWQDRIIGFYRWPK